MENLDLDPNGEPKKIKRKIRTRIKQNLIPAAEMDNLILERIAVAETEIKEIKTRKIRDCKTKSQKEKIQKPELEPTQIIFIKGPIILDFEEN